MKRIRPDFYLHFGYFDLPEVSRCTLSAPDGLHGLSALFLSDIHLRRQVSDGQLSALMTLLKAQEADLILLGGDYAETAEDCERFFEALSRVPAPLGRYCVAGNNDSECFPDRTRLQVLAEKNGARLLLNESVSPLEGLQIGGCDDHKHGKPQTGGLFENGGYRILLSHFPTQADCAADVMLSGHTHGGQWNAFGLTPYAFGFERGYRIQEISGLHRTNGETLLVSKGVGVSKLPLRLGVRPQIHLLQFSDR